MKLLFRELLHDPEVSTADLVRRVLADSRQAAGGILLGAVFGSLVFLMWYLFRSDVAPYEPNTAFWQIMLLFLASGFAGKRRSGTMVGGLMVGLVAGLVSALVVPAEYWLFSPGVSRGLVGFVMLWAFAPVFVMLHVAVGASMDGLSPLRHRAGRSLLAFVKAWRTGA